MKYVIQKKIQHAHYLETLNIKKIINAEMNVLTSREHKVYGETVTKN